MISPFLKDPDLSKIKSFNYKIRLNYFIDVKDEKKVTVIFQKKREKDEYRFYPINQSR